MLCVCVTPVDDVTGGVTEETSTESTTTIVKGKVEDIKEKVLDVAHTVGDEVGAPTWVVVSIFIGLFILCFSMYVLVHK